MRRYQVDMELNYQDQLSKLKHMQDQETNRLIRDNDRLQRIIAKTLGANMSSYDHSF